MPHLELENCINRSFRVYILSYSRYLVDTSMVVLVLMVYWYNVIGSNRGDINLPFCLNNKKSSQIEKKGIVFRLDIETINITDYKRLALLLVIRLQLDRMIWMNKTIDFATATDHVKTTTVSIDLNF